MNYLIDAIDKMTSADFLRALGAEPITYGEGLADRVRALEGYSAWIKADSCIPSQMDAIANELDAVRASGEETIHAGPFGDLPVLILSHDPNVLPSNWPAAVAKANSIVWNQMQEEAKGLSPESRRVIAKGSDHYLQNDRPDLVNWEIASLVTMIKNHRPFPDSLSTTEE